MRYQNTLAVAGSTERSFGHYRLEIYLEAVDKSTSMEYGECRKGKIAGAVAKLGSCLYVDSHLEGWK